MSLYDTRAIDKVKVVMMKGETGGGGGGASALAELSDVNISSPTNGQVLKYNSTTQKWENGTDSGLPENPLSTTHGGTGNADGYIRTGAASGSTIGTGATAEGSSNTASGDYSHAEGSSNEASGECSHAEGMDCYAEGDYSHAEGVASCASGESSHAEGGSSQATGRFSHAEGTYYNCATGNPDDDYTTASGEGSHAEGAACHATGYYAHAEGLRTLSSGGNGSHSEGYWTTASGSNSHAEGYKTTASSSCTHAGGTNATASGLHSFAHGQYVTAGYAQQSVLGRYNDNKSTSLFEIGNGVDANNRSNALEVDASGNVTAGGDVTDGQGNVLAEVKADLTAAVGLGNDAGKNLLKNTASTTTVNGVTFTVNSDKSVTVSTEAGGATTISVLELNKNIPNIDVGKSYTVSGVPVGGSAANYELFIVCRDSTNTATYYYEVGDDGVTFTVPNNTVKTEISIRVKSGIIITTPITFYPMIRPAGTSSAYVPYIESAKAYTDSALADKTDNSVVGTVENGTAASRAYAVGEHFIRNGKFCTCISAIASGATLTMNTNYVEGTVAEALTPVEGTTSVSGLKYIKQGNVVFVTGSDISQTAGATVDVTGLPAPYNNNYALALLMYGAGAIGYLQYDPSSSKWQLTKSGTAGSAVGAISLTYISNT